MNRTTNSTRLRSHTARACSAVCLTLAAWAAQAHEIVLEPQRDGVALRYGHSQDWQPVAEGKLVDLQLLRGDGDAQDMRARLRTRAPSMDMLLPTAALMSTPTSTPAMAAAKSAPAARQAVLLAARYDNGLWARLPAVDGAKAVARNTTRVMLPEATSVSNNLKFAKGLLPAGDDTSTYKRTVGHLLELVPQRNPATLKPGEPLDVLVLFKGQPLADVGIDVSNLKDVVVEGKETFFRTDSAGIARVTLLPKGVNTLGARVERGNDGSLGDASRAVGADKFVMEATYTFVR